MRSVYVLAKGVVVVPNSTRWTGPRLGASPIPALQRVANRPILAHVLDALSQAGTAEIAVLSPQDVADEIAECAAAYAPEGVVLRHLVREPGAAAAGALAEIASFVGEDRAILHRADGLLGGPILASIDLQDGGPAADAVLLVARDTADARRLHIVRRNRPAGVGDDGDRGVAGACVLAAGALSRLRGASPATDVIDFTAIAELIEHSGGCVRVQAARRWRHFAGDSLDLLDMNRAVLDTIATEAAPTPGDGNRFEGRIEIHPTAEISSSVIVGPVLVGAGARISDSYIGPHTSIAEGVRIEGAELERSIVLAGASVLHVGGRLVASVVGREAKIFRDLSMPRAMRMQVGEGDEVALC
jgi:glucose-1-phosphate thymidylyltransferase